MIFFINANIQKNKSGIEHAELKRAALFRDHHEPFKILLQEWSPRLHENIADAGLDDHDIINMFDYFQGTETVSEQIIHAEDIDFGVPIDSYEEDSEHNRILAFRTIKSSDGQIRQQLVARVNFFKESVDKRVASTEMFDGFGNLYAVNFYDFRGFVSLIQWYTQDNKIGTESWQTPAGRVVLESFNKNDAVGKYEKSGWRLIEKNDTVYNFQTIEELTKYFLDLVNETYFDKQKPNIFILDRSHLADWALQNLKKPAYTVIHLHNSQAGDPNDEQHSVLNNHYEYVLWNANRYDAIISATHKQSRDVAARFKPACKLFTIPVGVIPSEQFDQAHILMKDRQSHKVVALARIAPEKRLNELVKAVGIARKEVPDISLDLYGYRDGTDNFKAYRDIQTAVHDFGLEKVVNVHDYTTEVAKVEKQAQIFAVTSIMEGFNLSMMEGLSQGDVGLTYDVNYGPNELVVDDENGYIVPYGDYRMLAQKMIYLFSHPDQLQQKSDRAYELSRRYSEQNVWTAWQALLDDAQSSWSTKMMRYADPIMAGLAENGEAL